MAPDEVIARRWVSRHFGDPGPLRRLGAGRDYVMFRSSDDWAYRFPQRTEMVPRLRAEVAILPHLQGLPLAVPNPERVAEPRGDQLVPFVGYRMLAGEPAEPADAGRLLPSLMAFLDALHATPREPPFDVAVHWPKEVLYAPHPVAEAVLRFLDDPTADEPAALCHYDLGLEHVLCDGTGAPTGVIDWGDMTWTDPAVDWVGLLRRFPDAMEARHGDDPRLGRAWSHALRFALRDCLDKVEAGQDAMERWWSELQRLLDRARRSPSR